MSEELKITKERILEAANKCKDAKDILKTIFPEVFKEPEIVYPSNIVGVVFESKLYGRGTVVLNYYKGDTYSFLGLDRSLTPYSGPNNASIDIMLDFLKLNKYKPIGRVSLEDKYLAPL